MCVRMQEYDMAFTIHTGFVQSALVSNDANNAGRLVRGIVAH
jgi:hypothetical protein